MKALWGRYYCQNFTNEKTKAQTEYNVIKLLSIIAPRIKLFHNNSSADEAKPGVDIFPISQVLQLTYMFQTHISGAHRSAVKLANYPHFADYETRSSVIQVQGHPLSM